MNRVLQSLFLFRISELSEVEAFKEREKVSIATLSTNVETFFASGLKNYFHLHFNSISCKLQTGVYFIVKQWMLEEVFIQVFIQLKTMFACGWKVSTWRIYGNLRELWINSDMLWETD